MTRDNRKAFALSLFVPLVAWIYACSDGRNRVGSPVESFDLDASPDAAACPFQCSLDGRSIIRSCTGDIVETCPSELACGAAECQAPCAAAAAEGSSNGCAFYLQAPAFDKRLPQSCYATFVVNTSNQPIELELELRGEVLDTSKSLYRTVPGSAELIRHTGPIKPGESAILFVSDRAEESALGVHQVACPEGVVPATHVDPVPHGTGVGASFRLASTAPVSLTAIYPFGGAQSYNPSATLVLPVTAWGTEHVLMNAWDESYSVLIGLDWWPAAQIVAAEDDTEVNIRPRSNLNDGPGVVGGAAGAWRTYRLDKGQHLQFMQPDVLSGSIVTSTKPTTTIAGHSCARIPAARAACDIAAQQLPPFDQWGSEYVGVGYRPRLGAESEMMPYRIVAAKDGTLLDYDPEVPPGAPITMSAGEVVTFRAGTGEAFVVRTQDAEHPIYLAAYMSGGGRSSGDYLDGPGRTDGYDGRGDPEFVNVVATGQYMNSYSFYADPTYAETSLVVVRAKGVRGEAKDVSLECAGVLTEWRPIGTRGDYEFTRVDLSRGGGPGATFGDKVCQSGLHRMWSDGPFTATIWGWDTYASYAYPGGMAHRKLVTTPLVPVR